MKEDKNVTITRLQAERNIKLYFWYKVLGEPLFWGPILISSIMHLASMPFSEVLTMEAIVMSCYSVIEGMSGSFADKYGRKKSVVIGSVISVFGIILFSTMNSELDAWIANIVFMLGCAFKSGADVTLLRQSMVRVDKESEFHRYLGYLNGSRLLLTAIASLCAGYMAEIHLRLPLYLSVPNCIVVVLLVAFFTEPNPRYRKQTNGIREFIIQMVKSVLETFVIFFRALGDVKRSAQLWWILLFFTLIGLSSKAWFFSYNPYFELVKIEIKYYGYAFFWLNLIASVASYSSSRITKKLSEQKTLTLLYILIGIPIVVMGTFVSVYSVSMILLQNIVRGISDPLLVSMNGRYLKEEYESTVQSLSTAVRGFLELFVLGGYGFLMKAYGLPLSLQFLGLSTLILGMYMTSKYTKVFS